MIRHLPPTATPLCWKAQRAAYSSQLFDVTRFRSALEGYLGVPACFLASSGRTALFMLLKTLREQTPDDARREVVIPAYTCPSVAKVVIDAMLRPRFVDIGPYTLTYSSSELATAVSKETLAVIVVHPFGIPHPLDSVMAIAEKCGALVIEDAAQSMGARQDGKRVGSSADFGLFSLGPGKPISTGGGGIVCTANLAAAGLLRHAWQKLPDSTGLDTTISAIRMSMLGAAFHPSGWWLATRLGAQRVGESEAAWRYSLRGLSAAQAAAGMALLPRLDSINAARCARGRQLIAALQHQSSIHLPGAEHDARSRTQDDARTMAEPIFLRFPVVFESESTRDAALRALNGSAIGAGKMYGKSLATYFPDYADGVYPGAEHVAQCLLTLPTHHYVSDTDVSTMVEAITEILQSDA